MSEESEMRGLIDEVVHERLDQLYGLWVELGLDLDNKQARNETIRNHFEELLDRMVAEEFAAKKKILNSLEMHTR